MIPSGFESNFTLTVPVSVFIFIGAFQFAWNKNSAVSAPSQEKTALKWKINLRLSGRLRGIELYLSQGTRKIILPVRD